MKVTILKPFKYKGVDFYVGKRVFDGTFSDIELDVLSRIGNLKFERPKVVKVKEDK